MFDDRFRKGFDSRVVPIGEGLGRLGFSPNLLTMSGLMFAAACAYSVGSQHLRTGFIFFLLSALPDVLDGAVARATNLASTRGAFFDSVADRVSDSLYLIGIAWYLNATRHDNLVLLPICVLAAASIIPYERAKAESLGFYAKGGLMERLERMILIGFALALPHTMIAILWFLLGASILTALQRFARVWRQASSELIPRRRLLLLERWDAWREQTAETLRARRLENAERRDEKRAQRSARRGSREMDSKDS